MDRRRINAASTLMYRTEKPWMGAPTQNFIQASTAGIGSLGEPQKTVEEPELTVEFLEEGMEEEKG
tara:strand:+ start:1205 stop:1402 length:198 start_codon:yes stop_codon:yes gene_type:complete